MPPTRRKGGNAPAGSRNAQSTLRFGSKSRVTKPTVNDLPSKSKKEQELVSEPQSESLPATHEVPIRQQKAEEVLSPTPQSEEDVLANKISEAQVERYWKAEEKKRKAPRGFCHSLYVYDWVRG